MPDSAAAGQRPQTLRSVRRLLERLDREEDRHQPAGVALALPALGGGVTVAQDQEVELVGGIAGALQRDQLAGRRRARGVDQHVGRIDHQRPDLAEVVLPVALLQDDLHRAVGKRGAREAQRLGEGAVDLGSLAGRLPLAVDRRETARVEQAARAAVDHLEEVLAEIRVVDRLRQVSRPRQRLDDHPLEREALLAGVAGVEVVDTQRLRRRRGGSDAGDTSEHRGASSEAEGGEETRRRGRGCMGLAPDRQSLPRCLCPCTAVPISG